MRKRKQLEKFLEENLDNIYRFAYTYMRNREDAEDVVSDSVVKALKSANRIKDEKNIKCYVYSIVANTALTALKKNGRYISLEPDKMEFNFTEDDYSHINFESMINLLDENSKAVVVLKCCDDLTFEEIGKVLNINENTAKTRFYSAIKKLRGEIV
ncbi:MAG: RNA polymerase sigma factor [Clostridia bacterium]